MEWIDEISTWLSLSENSVAMFEGKDLYPTKCFQPNLYIGSLKRIYGPTNKKKIEVKKYSSMINIYHVFNKEVTEFMYGQFRLCT